MSPDTTTPYLTVQELAALLRVPVGTIYGWRSSSPPRGPRGIRVGKHVRYSREEVARWLDAQADPDPRSTA